MIYLTHLTTPFKLFLVVTLLFLLPACASDEMPRFTEPSPSNEPVTTATSIPQMPIATNTAVVSTPGSDVGVIAFTSAQDGNMDIYLMSADGSNHQRLTNHPADDYWPAWSPDGERIAFASQRDGNFEIYLIDADGSNLRRLTHEAGNDLEPDWSPDERQIAFMFYQGGKSAVYLMNADGSGRQRLTENDANNYLPKWSPDGAQIVFVSERDGNPEIYLMDADGGNQMRLTDNPLDDSYPSWSPDGERISFYSIRDGAGELYVMDLKSRELHPLTGDNAPVWVSDWSSDGGQIVFTSNRDGNREIYTMDADRSNLVRLTDNNVLDGIPAWRPEGDDLGSQIPTDMPLSFVENGQQLGPTRSWDVAVGDLDGDGDLDAFTANDSTDGHKIWFNDGQGRFSMSEQTLDPCLRVTLGDLDDDSDLDALVINWDAEKDNWFSDASILLNDGSGHFYKSQENLGGEEVLNMAFGDLDADGSLDIFFAVIGADTVWLNDNTGVFDDTGQRLETGIDAAVALGDIDQDGDLDALTGGWDGPAKIWLNDGSGNFVSSIPDMTGSDLHIHGLSLGDLDGDGDLDAVVGLANGSPHEVWLNQDDGLLNRAQTLSAPLAQDVALGDIDGDGDLDAVMALGFHTGGHTRVWLNDGGGSFVDSQLRLGDTYSSAVDLGDLDGDGDLDIFAAHTQWQPQGHGEPDRVWMNERFTSTQLTPDTASLGDVFIRPSDGMGMVFVPAGSFRMGGGENDPAASEDELPEHWVTLDGFWIDRTEVTNDQYYLCADSGGCRNPLYAEDPAYNGGDMPVVGVAWGDAVDYCAWAGGRLPTEAEWEYAAKGEDGSIYPWGNEFDGDRLNFCDLNCEESWAEGTSDDGHKEAAPVGTYPGGASWVGALDMAGNVWEWVSDWCGSYPSEAQVNPGGPEAGNCKIIRGGAWASPPAGVRTTYRVLSGEITPDIRHPNIGFRCVLPDRK